MSKLNQYTTQYAFNGIPGCVFQGVSEEGNIPVSLYRRSKDNSISSTRMPWLMICEHHNGQAIRDKLSDAKADVIRPQSWCPYCINDILVSYIPDAVKSILDQAAVVATEAAREQVRYFCFKEPRKYEANLPGMDLRYWEYKDKVDVMLSGLNCACGTAHIELPITLAALRPFYKELFSKVDGRPKYRFNNRPYIWTTEWAIWVHLKQACAYCTRVPSWSNNRASCGACTYGRYEITLKHAFSQVVNFPMLSVEEAAHTAASAFIIKSGLSNKAPIRSHID